MGSHLTRIKTKQRNKPSSMAMSEVMTILILFHVHRNKVFDGYATRGKGTMGWIYGFKLHLIVTECGDILSVKITQGNTDDRA